jgi:hypothetical protein
MKLIPKLMGIAAAGFIVLFCGAFMWAYWFSHTKDTYEPRRHDDNLRVAWFTDTQWMLSWYHFGSIRGITGQMRFAANGYRLGYFDYAIHTGDLSDDAWQDPNNLRRLSNHMRRLDRAGMPFGVLAGNHDYNPKDGAAVYWRHFGSNRFENNGVFVADWRNNLGHVDIVERNGFRYLFLYLSWYEENCRFVRCLDCWDVIEGVLCTHTDEESCAYVWANKMLKEFESDHDFAIILTHGGTKNGINGSVSNAKFDLIYKNPSIIGFAYGHWFPGGRDNYTYPRTNTREGGDLGQGRMLQDGRQIVEMHYNHQQDDAAGQFGITRVIEIDPHNGKIYLKSWSNRLNEYRDRQEGTFRVI